MLAYIRSQSGVLVSLSLSCVVSLVVVSSVAVVDSLEVIVSSSVATVLSSGVAVASLAVVYSPVVSPAVAVLLLLTRSALRCSSCARKFFLMLSSVLSSYLPSFFLSLSSEQSLTS